MNNWIILAIHKWFPGVNHYVSVSFYLKYEFFYAIVHFFMLEIENIHKMTNIFIISQVSLFYMFD